MKKILIICDELKSFNILGDTTYLIFLTAKELGYQVFYALPQDVSAQNNQVFALTKELDILITTKDKPRLEWFNIIYNKEYDLTTFDTVLVRNNPPFNMEYYYLTQLLTLAQKQGAKVINSSISLRNCNEKLTILNFPEIIVPTVVTKNKEVIYKFLNTHFECVIKPLDLMAGSSIFKISVNDVNCNPIIETITNNYSQTIMLQQFISEIVFGDKRIFIINGEVIDYCLCRIPQQNQIRSNLAVGGRGEVQKLQETDYKIANIVATWVRAQNINFVGLDVIGNKLTEVNITSPTGARQLFNETGINIAKLLLEAI